jgi:hypothetical protein
MVSTTSALRARPVAGEPLPAVRIAVLARIACEGGASKAEVLRDLAPLLAPRLPQAEARLALERGLAALIMTGHGCEDHARFSSTPAGLAFLAERLGLRSGAAKLDWPHMRDVWLVAGALHLSGEATSRLKRLAKSEGLRAAVVQKAYGLPVRPDVSPSKLRSQLAVIALERAFGNKVKSGFGQGGLSAKAGRLLAAQLAGSSREHGTDARLVAALAAEHAGAKKPDADAIRIALLRRWLGDGLEAEASGGAIVSQPRPIQPAPFAAANDAASARPDLAGFSTAVLDLARMRAEGWPGNRKAFISHVWQAIRGAHPEWRLTEIEFKYMLAEAHRAGLVVLANADLRDKSTVKEVQDSAIAYKNTVWHLVRVEE